MSELVTAGNPVWNSWGICIVPIDIWTCVLYLVGAIFDSKNTWHNVFLTCKLFRDIGYKLYDPKKWRMNKDALITAVYRKSLASVQRLLKYTSVVDSINDVPLMYYQHPYCIILPQKQVNSPLVIAIMSNRVDIVEALVNCGANPLAKISGHAASCYCCSRNCFEMAIDHGYADIVSLFIKDSKMMENIDIGAIVLHALEIQSACCKLTFNIIECCKILLGFDRNKDVCLFDLYTVANSLNVVENTKRQRLLDC